MLVAKYVPGFSTVAPPLAGTMHVGLCRFIACGAVAAALWAAVPMLAGYFFRREVEWVLDRIETMGAGAATFIAILVLVYIAFKAGQRYLLIRFLRMIRIRVGELRTMIDAGEEPIILDARSSLAREAEPRKIPGAIVIDLDTVEQVIGAVPPDRDVVVYCS